MKRNGKMSESPVQFIKVSKEVVLSFLKGAKKRIVIAKPGYFVDEIDILLSFAKKKNVRCDVYVDTNDNSIRYGFGEQAALEILNSSFKYLNVKGANYIRMAIVIVDDKVMVYSPVALSWEDVPEEIDFPNGFIGKKSLTNSLIRQIDGEAEAEVIAIEGTKMTIDSFRMLKKKQADIHSEITETISKLKENPPIDPAKLKKIRFYRNNYKLLKMTIHGVRMKNKSISLRPFNRMLPNTIQRLKSSWSVLTSEDVESLKAIKDFLSSVNTISSQYTFDAKRFGTLIELKNKRQIENCIAFQVYDLLDQLMGASHLENDPHQKASKKSLVDLLKESRLALINHLYPQVKDEKNCWDKLFEHDKFLQRKMNEQEIKESDAVKQAVETFIDFKLNFPNAQEMIEYIHVEFDYYDISDELLSKEEFIENVKKFELQIRDYQEGYSKSSQISLF